MKPLAQQTESTLLFQRVRVSPSDQRSFIGRLIMAAALTAAGAALAFTNHWAGVLAGAVLLGAVFTHLVELQHQCLHHSAFMRARLHRLIGVPIGIPLLVAYSHYRVRHLQHHRHLGTPQDSEFFGFDTRKPITWGALLRDTFNYGRTLMVMKEIIRSFRGTWRYDAGQISDRRQREIVNEYRLMGLLILGAVAASAVGYGDVVLRLWLLPLLIAIPLHFLIELPEHILCDTNTADVLRNTRSIRGSWFSTWFTNGNNLHIEHHAAMMVPINRLPERHGEVRDTAKYVQRSYPQFFRQVIREANRNSGGAA